MTTLAATMPRIVSEPGIFGIFVHCLYAMKQRMKFPRMRKRDFLGVVAIRVAVRWLASTVYRNVAQGDKSMAIFKKTKIP